MKRFVEKGSKVFFTSDHHFGHANIIKYCDRPYKDVEEMDADMVLRWNSVVKEDDPVFHLGDFTLGGPEQAQKYFSQLNGKIYILSNPWHHDKRWIKEQMDQRKYYESKYHGVELLPPMVVLENSYHKNDSGCIVLCHYPIQEWDRAHYGSLHFFGHSHIKAYIKSAVDSSFNVGVDLNKFTPMMFSS